MKRKKKTSHRYSRTNDPFLEPYETIVSKDARLKDAIELMRRCCTMFKSRIFYLILVSLDSSEAQQLIAQRPNDTELWLAYARSLRVGSKRRLAIYERYSKSSMRARREYAFHLVENGNFESAIRILSCAVSASNKNTASLIARREYASYSNLDYNDDESPDKVMCRVLLESLLCGEYRLLSHSQSQTHGKEKHVNP